MRKMLILMDGDNGSHYPYHAWAACNTGAMQSGMPQGMISASINQM
jgi:hypothetical protein